MTGKVLGNRYEILEEIGNGGMARVFKARCRLLKRFVAVKVLRPEFAKDSEFLARFSAEAQAAAALSHQNIVSIYDVGREGDIEYIVMEYIEGVTLKDFIKQHTLLPWKQALEFTVQICKALSCAHKKGIIHRDIKPQNILLTADGVLKVTDFGIARAASASSLTFSGNTMGSVHYLSPEQARGGYTDEKSDVYSLGIVMYEMVTGRVPFGGDNPVSIAIKQIQEQPVSPKEFNLAVPLAVEAIILKAMNKDQSTRYQSARAMLADLELALVSPDSAIATDDADSGATKKIPVITAEAVGGTEPQEGRQAAEQPAPRRKGERTGKDDMKKSEKKTIIWAIVTSVVVVAALVIGSLAVLLPDLFKGGKTDVVTVPELTGKLYDEVKDSFAAQNISVKITQRIPDNDSAEGTVLSQEPKAGKTVKTPLEIEVTVSEGAREFTLENYALKGFIEVKLALENKEVVVLERNEENDDIAEGMIIRTNPGPNAKVKAGDSVTLYVSSGAGEKQVLMPNVVGLSLQQAKKIITDNGLLEGDAVKEVYSDKPKGEVLEQSEAANTNIKAYTKINLTVSKGQEPRSKSVGITVPQDREVTRIKIVQDGVVVHDASHNKSEGAFNFNVSGNGTVVVQVYHDGNLAQTVPVTL